MDASPVRVLALCGSLQARSSNRSLIEAARRLAPAGVVVTPHWGLAEIPLFNPDLDGESAPEAVLALRQSLAASDAVLIACPEYGHSLPGALKNAVDWVIPSGELERKIVAITASTPALGRGRLGLRALRDTLYAVRADVVGGEPIPRGDGEDAAVTALLSALSARVHRQREAVVSRPAQAVQIAVATAEDAPAYNAFLRRGIAAHPDTLRIAIDDIDRAPFSTEPSADGQTFVACASDARWLGVVTIERERGRHKRRHIAWIVRMYVDADHAGSGIGRRLLQAAIAHARGLAGVDKLNLTVAAHNLAAIQLYTSEGFREFAREDDAFRSPAPQSELTMSLRLAW